MATVIVDALSIGLLLIKQWNLDGVSSANMLFGKEKLTDLKKIKGFWKCSTHCGLVMPYGDIDLVNSGPGNGLLPDGTKPLHELM